MPCGHFRASCLHAAVAAPMAWQPPLLLLLRTGVIILSPEYVRKEYPMKELRNMLLRWEAGGVALVPVLYGVTLEQLQGIRRLYDQERWCVAQAKPPKTVLDGWAGDLQQLLRCTVIRPDQVLHHRSVQHSLVDSTACSAAAATSVCRVLEHRLQRACHGRTALGTMRVLRLSNFYWEHIADAGL
jgi:hypothetical protein